MRAVMRWAAQGFWLVAIVSGVLAAVLAHPRAQPAPGEEGQVLGASEALGNATRGGDKSAVRRLLTLQFTFTDENGQDHERKEFLNDLKSVAAAPATEVRVKIYGSVAMVTGHRRSALGNDAFFLDIWAKQKRAWRALTMQDVVLGTADASSAQDVPLAPEKSDALARLFDCRNPCQMIPYRVRSPAEQDVVNAFQAIEKATIAHDAQAWGKRVADEFVHYRSDYLPVAKADRIAIIESQKQHDIPAALTVVKSMRLWVYGDGAAMISTNGVPGDPQPQLRVARVWVKRSGQWQMAISAQTAIKNP